MQWAGCSEHLDRGVTEAPDAKTEANDLEGFGLGEIVDVDANSCIDGVTTFRTWSAPSGHQSGQGQNPYRLRPPYPCQAR